MNRQLPKKGKAQKERIVCFCYSVPEDVIVDAIVNKGCHSLMEIRRETYASTGCAGCTEEVKKLLKKHTPHPPKQSTTPSGEEPNES